MSSYNTYIFARWLEDFLGLMMPVLIIIVVGLIALAFWRVWVRNRPVGRKELKNILAALQEVESRLEALESSSGKASQEKQGGKH
ncbi:MAG: hypothetical protein K9L68_05790 [Spirochaetales bacterium]|nr:hypothetical protein [Spirochaetales bacterium]MCF7938092.1 hypothetical protein [Spirochaetales bacterium]